MYSHIARLIEFQGEKMLSCKELHQLFPNNKKHGDIARHLKRQYGIEHQTIITKGKAVSYIFHKGIGKYRSLYYEVGQLNEEISNLLRNKHKLVRSNELLGFGLCYAIFILIILSCIAYLGP